MTDQEIKKVIRWIGISLCESLDDEPIYNPDALSLMLLATLLVFPSYYRKFELYLNLLS